MSAYMLFVDGETSGHKLTEKLGISQIELGENHLTWVFCAGAGPGGQAGMLGFWLDDRCAGHRAFEPEKQTWVAVPVSEGTPQYYVGTHNDQPLEPGDIIRLKPAERSVMVELEDGQKWGVPVAKWLPHRWKLDAEGQVSRQPAAPFADFCSKAADIVQQIMGFDAEKNLEIAFEMAYVCQALAINYRLAPPIISALDLLGDKSSPAVMMATIEFPEIQDVELEKKNTE